MNKSLIKIRKSFRDPLFCVWTSLLAATALAFTLVAYQGIPAPGVHDEFAYLLAADTYSAGRATNPTHPMWQHFETFQVIHQPTYIGKYQPAQSLTLAAGQKLGHPIIGACLATGISISALVWMLTGWLPRKYFWVAWLFAVLHPGLQIFWGQSYWGGAVPLAGAALLLGALGRVTAKMEIRLALIAAIGVLLLANSRPFEGAVLTAIVGCGLLWKLRSNPGWHVQAFLLRLVLPAGLVLLTGVSAMLAYNFSVTGSPLKMPYHVHESTYGWNPLFLWQTAKQKPEYRHHDMERLFVVDKTANDEKYKSVSDIIHLKTRTAKDYLNFFCGGAEWFALLGIPWLLRKSRYRFALVLGVPVLLAALATPWAWAHYGAPAAPLIILMMLGGWIEIWQRLSSRALRPVRWALVGLALLMYGNWFSIAYRSHDAMNRNSWANNRSRIQQELLSEAGDDLVLVRYTPDHNLNREWVYNAADINSAGVVWAREISDERRSELLNYFSGRRVWVLDADAENPLPQPFFNDDHAADQLGMHSR